MGLSGSQGLSQSQAKRVGVAEAVWTSASLSEPPGCHLPQRVQKRKAEADLQRQKAKQQALQQQRVAANAVLVPNADPAPEEKKSNSSKENSAIAHSTGVHDSDCIVLDSPVAAVCKDKSTSNCSQAHILEPQISQTTDPMKRMRLQALQQELVAAKQTVVDLERMIRNEQLS